MTGKGSGRRPQQIPEDEAAANWARIFRKNESPAKPDPNNEKEQDDGE